MLLKSAKWLRVNLLFFYFGILLSNCYGQEEQVRREQYLLTEEQKLQIIVHIWGEVNKPGQYIVPDGTNVLELISLAGGPTEYSNLSSVKLTREYFEAETDYSGEESFGASGMKEPLRKKEIYKINLNRHLDKTEWEHIHVLKPGDVVKVNRNNWYRFQILIRVIYQVAIIAQGLYFYSLLFE